MNFSNICNKYILRLFIMKKIFFGEDDLKRKKINGVIIFLVIKREKNVKVLRSKCYLRCFLRYLLS